MAVKGHYHLSNAATTSSAGYVAASAQAANGRSGPFSRTSRVIGRRSKDTCLHLAEGIRRHSRGRHDVPRRSPVFSETASPFRGSEQNQVARLLSRTSGSPLNASGGVGRHPIPTTCPDYPCPNPPDPRPTPPSASIPPPAKRCCRCCPGRRHCRDVGTDDPLYPHRSRP